MLLTEREYLKTLKRFSSVCILMRNNRGYLKVPSQDVKQKENQNCNV